MTDDEELRRLQARLREWRHNCRISAVLLCAEIFTLLYSMAHLFALGMWLDLALMALTLAWTVRWVLLYWRQL